MESIEGGVGGVYGRRAGGSLWTEGWVESMAEKWVESMAEKWVESMDGGVGGVQGIRRAVSTYSFNELDMGRVLMGAADDY